MKIITALFASFRKRYQDISSCLEPLCNVALLFRAHETWHVCLFHYVCFEALCSCANRWWQHSKTSSFHVIIFSEFTFRKMEMYSLL